MAAVAPATDAGSSHGPTAPPPTMHEHHHGHKHHHHHHSHHHGHHHGHGHGHRRREHHMRKISVDSSNALEHFGALEAAVLKAKKRVVVLLDYDGTLTPIVNDPAKALLSSRTRDILVELAERCVVGIVSGRSLPKVQGFVQVPSLFYAGSHGFDIWGPSLEDSMRYQVAADQLPKLAALRDRLTERLAGVRGAAVEDNVFSVSVHYRNCDPGDVPAVLETVESLRADYPSLRLGHGKCVYELRPDITWDKGKAMVWLLEALGLRGHEEEVCTIYIGDDVTDEDAFYALVEEAEARQGAMEGIGIVVTDEDKVTGAKYSLRNPDEVAAFLLRLVESRGDDFAGGNKAFFAAGKFNPADVCIDALASTGGGSGSGSGAAVEVEAAAVGGAEAAGDGAPQPVTPSTPPMVAPGTGVVGGLGEEEEEDP